MFIQETFPVFLSIAKNYIEDLELSRIPVQTKFNLFKIAMIFIISKSFLKESKSERFRELYLMNKFLFAEKCEFLQMMCFHAVLSERDGLNIVPSRKTAEIQVHYTLYYPRANIISRS